MPPLPEVAFFTIRVFTICRWRGSRLSLIKMSLNVFFQQSNHHHIPQRKTLLHTSLLLLVFQKCAFFWRLELGISKNNMEWLPVKIRYQPLCTSKSIWILTIFVIFKHSSALSLIMHTNTSFKLRIHLMCSAVGSYSLHFHRTLWAKYR